MVSDSSDETQSVLRLWTYSQAPLEFRQALDGIDAQSWVAHVPPDLIGEPVLSLLEMNSTSSKLTRVLLADGSALFAGPFPTSESIVDRSLETAPAQRQDERDSPVRS